MAPSKRDFDDSHRDSDYRPIHIRIIRNTGRIIAAIVINAQYECVILDCSSPEKLLLQIDVYSHSSNKVEICDDDLYCDLIKVSNSLAGRAAATYLLFDPR